MDVALSAEPLDHAALLESVRGPASGAVTLFLGTVRELSEGQAVLGLDYEAHPALALALLADVVAAARQRWPLHAARVHHRVGRLELGDVAVAVAVAAAHRAEAFAAAQWIMDDIKRRVPIWKRERWAAGGADWVHPTTPAGEAP
jgi:molybdopterin synthase catalytic subunit